MSLVNIKNPENKEIVLNFQGDIYTIGAKETKEFPSDVAKQWIEIYGFMTIAEKEVKEVKEEKKEKKEDPKKK